MLRRNNNVVKVVVVLICLCRIFSSNFVLSLDFKSTCTAHQSHSQEAHTHAHIHTHSYPLTHTHTNKKAAIMGQANARRQKAAAAASPNVPPEILLKMVEMYNQQYGPQPGLACAPPPAHFLAPPPPQPCFNPPPQACFNPVPAPAPAPLFFSPAPVPAPAPLQQFFASQAPQPAAPFFKHVSTTVQYANGNVGPSSSFLPTVNSAPFGSYQPQFPAPASFFANDTSAVTQSNNVTAPATQPTVGSTSFDATNIVSAGSNVYSQYLNNFSAAFPTTTTTATVTANNGSSVLALPTVSGQTKPQSQHQSPPKQIVVYRPTIHKSSRRYTVVA